MKNDNIHYLQEVSLDTSIYMNYSENVISKIINIILLSRYNQ